jgi:glycyl-tRNA synthetase
MQGALACLDDYWARQGCVKVQPVNTEVGAGTMNPATFLRVLGPEPWRVAYVEPSVRPDDARYGKNPNRIQCHTQYQVILKPEPGNPQELYLGSLEALGIDVRAHDVRFVEDNWASPALGAWGQGWEVWLDGLEITQFTYFQQAGGIRLDPVACELTYGMERIMMALQEVRHFKEISYTDDISYGELYGQAEYEMSRYYLDEADVAANRALLDIYAGEARRLIALRLPVPAYSYVLKCSHTFNVLDARGAVSTAERAAMFAQMQQLSGEVAQLWMSTRADQGHPLGTVAPLEPAGPASFPEPLPTGEAHEARDFVLEVGTEEMAPSAAAMAREQFSRLVADGIATTRLDHGPVTVYATPKRLIAVVTGVAARESDYVRTVRGPKVQAAFDPAGNPTGAATGFARSNGVSVADLGRMMVANVEYLSFDRQERGRTAAEALTPPMSAAIAGLHSAKNMRWRDPELSFNRPIRWLTALWGDHIVPVRAGALTAGRSTRVLRTADKPVVEVRAAETLLDQLTAAGIRPDPAERRELIEAASRELAATVGGTVDIAAEAALIDQVTFLVEAPTAILGHFDPGYLELPEAVLVTVMRKHQRYLPVRDSEGALLPHFVAIANGPVDAQKVRAGNEAVLRARYEDAAYFYRADLAVPLGSMRDRLSKLSFTDRLGTVLDRARRVSDLANDIADVLGIIPEDRQILDRARELVKFDLGSEMVTDLTSLAGIMAREYAMAAGEPAPVAQALFEAELPRNTSDHLPASLPGAILSAADRLDYLTGLAATVGLPTGSSDPFALRRAALGLLAVYRRHPALSALALPDALAHAAAIAPVAVSADTLEEIWRFLTGRLEQLLTEEGEPVDWVRAVLVKADRPASADVTLAQLHKMIDRPDFRRVAEAMQRTRRITPRGTAAAYDPAALTEPAEIALHEALAAVRDSVGDDTDLEHFTESADYLADAVGTLFEQVFVMSDDAAERSNRLGLIAAVAALGDPVLGWDQLRL